MASTLDDYYPSYIDESTGLLNKPDGYGDYAFVRRSGPVTYFNALYAYALRSAAVLARHRGSPDAEKWEARAGNISDALNEHNFDSEAGAFFDGTCDGETYCATHAQDGNSLAILSGTTDPPRAESILNYWTKSARRERGNAFYDNDLLGSDYGERVYAFISYFEIAARFEAGLVPSALEETRRLWGYMAARDPGVTFWEGAGEAYEADAFKSRSHGWSTGVVPLLTRYVLGVTPRGPGFETWSVKPRAGDLTWARGVVPVPGGKGISVKWEKGEGGFVMEVEVPEGLGEGTIAVPVGEGGSVTVDGEVVWSGGRVVRRAATATGDGYVEFEARAGRVNVEVGGAREL